MDQYLDHQLTGWYSSNESYPQYIGEYNASTMKNPRILRWWNGVDWSAPYSVSLSNEGARRIRRSKPTVDKSPMYFRGLKQKPKIHTILYLQPLKD
jgi:hypothetical protein